MFFVGSKLLWIFAAPTNLMLLAAFAGAVLSFGRFARFGRRLALASLSLALFVAVAPVGVWLIEPLEDRFPPPAADMAAPHGIIVLGGAINQDMGQTRNQASFDDGAARVTEAVSLARRFPGARLIYTGGSSSLTHSGPGEAQDAARILAALGVDPARIQLEDRSRNTEENATFTRDLLRPDPAQVWLLVTSAYHMPRSMGLFRKAGFNVIAYPVDYRSKGWMADWRLNQEFSRGLRQFDVAVHEWIGLIAYRVSGKIDELFPAP